MSAAAVARPLPAIAQVIRLRLPLLLRERIVDYFVPSRGHVDRQRLESRGSDRGQTGLGWDTVHGVGQLILVMSQK